MRPNLAVILTALTGCVSDETVSTESQDLVGAYPTSARPEVGQVFIAGGCTGTLISDRVVLTAAHCLSPAYTGWIAPAGSTFQFTDAGGTLRSYAIDKTLTFHPQGDVALAHLTAAVPASQAVPATIAAAPPIFGDLSTIYGYGCNSSSGTGGGIKRSYTFRYGDLTNVLCPGDAGGPVRFGYSDAIWGVSVAGANPDQIAMVSYLLPQIDSAKRHWDGYSEVGYDRPGFDYAHTSAGSSEMCNAYCDHDTHCKAWAFVPSTTDCYLKSAVPDPIPNGAVIAGVARTQEVGYDRPGGDYAIVNFTPTTGSAGACQFECERNAPCMAWSFVPSTSQCWLKHSVPYAVANTGVTSGVRLRVRDYEVGYDRPGGDLYQVHATDLDICSYQCALDSRCKAFTYSSTRTAPGTSNNCWLKDTVEPAVPSPDYVSGVRAGMAAGVQYRGTPYRSIFMSNPLWPSSQSSANAFECQSACTADDQCKAWRLGLEPDAGSMCYLLSTPSTLAVSPGYITGFKYAEFVH